MMIDKITKAMLDAWVAYKGPEPRDGAGVARQIGAVRHAFYAGWMARDTDGSPKGTDPQGLDGEAATAGAAESGIAQTPSPSENINGK